jgi:LmbE family N-acetylglucosaminyl deacetylase
MISAGRSVIVLAPHTDDGEFGAGGTIARLVEAGAEVRYVAFSTASRSLPAGFPADTLAHEVRAATAALGIPAENLTVHDFEVRTFPSLRQDILEILVAMNADLQPDLVLTPSLGDIHQDHETIARESMRAFKRTTLLGYEIPWNCFNFRQQAYVELQAAHLDRKVAALQCYRSQAHRNYANEEYVRNVARTRGIEGGRELAEVFEVYRLFL